MNLLSSPPKVIAIIAGEISSVKEVLSELPIPILTKIGLEPTREALIDLHLLVSGNAAYIASNLGGGCPGHLALTLTSI